MTHIIVLFKLHDAAARSRYEAWARGTDLPVVRDLASVGGFSVLRCDGLYGADGAAPCDYVEIIRVNDPDGFGDDIATPTMARVAAEFREFAADPVFIRCTDIEEGN